MYEGVTNPLYYDVIKSKIAFTYAKSGVAKSGIRNWRVFRFVEVLTYRRSSEVVYVLGLVKRYEDNSAGCEGISYRVERC